MYQYVCLWRHKCHVAAAGAPVLVRPVCPVWYVSNVAAVMLLLACFAVRACVVLYTFRRVHPTANV